jgi:hypothetical protein
MITTRLAQLIPTSNHPRRNITIINVVNYDKFQYVDKEQPAYDQLSPLTNKQDTNTQILNRVTKKSSNGITYLGDEFGEYAKIKIKGKIKWKHKFKDNMPLKDEL